MPGLKEYGMESVSVVVMLQLPMLYDSTNSSVGKKDLDHSQRSFIHFYVKSDRLNFSRLRKLKEQWKTIEEVVKVTVKLKGRRLRLMFSCQKR